MKKIIGFIAVVLLTVYIAASAFVFPQLEHERQQWTLVFFDAIALFEICVLSYFLLLKED
jgi:heme/copper-type cytochrome/quinol oxidase subunit 4